MTKRQIYTICLLALCFPLSAIAQEPETSQPADDADVKAMMAKAEGLTKPGKNHKILERFLGTWEVETRFVMAGKKTEPEKGKSEFAWLMEGRWIQSSIDGKMMGQPAKGFMIMGYDNFKQSFVTTSVNNLDTAMLRSEGDLTKDGKALITYGTLNEYLTGEHDKMVKYVWRFVDDDTIVLEVHDLHIGEENTMVVEETFRRVKN